MKNKKRNLANTESEPKLKERTDDVNRDTATDECVDPTAVISLPEHESTEPEPVSLDTLRYVSHLPCYYELCMVPGPDIVQ